MGRNWDRETMTALASALDVAGAAPITQNAVAYAAKIPWPMIHKLRIDLEALGVDWRAFAVDYQARMDAAAEAAQEQRTARNRERNIGLETYSQPGGDAAE